MKEYQFQQTVLPIETVVIRLEDTLQILTSLPFLREMNIQIADVAAIHLMLEDLKFRFVRLSSEEQTISSGQFVKILLHQLHRYRRQFSSEEIYHFLVEPLVDHLFGQYEPRFAAEIKSWFCGPDNHLM